MILPSEIRDIVYKEMLVTVAWYQPLGGDGAWWKISFEYQVPPNAIQTTYPLTNDSWYYLLPSRTIYKDEPAFSK
jgi:hypothetical protein